MAQSSPPPAEQRSRSWGRRLAFWLGGSALLLTVLLTTGWICRVPFLNFLLTDSNSVWRLRIDGLDWSGTQLTATGLQLFHSDQTEPVFSADSITTAAHWQDLKQGHLGAIKLLAPLVHWRSGLRSDPVNLAKRRSTGPLVTWDSLQLTNGKIDVAEPDRFSFTSTLSGKGGAGAWHEEGRLALQSQDLDFCAVEYQMTLTETFVTSFKINAESIKLQASVEPTTGVLTLTTPRLIGSRLQLSKAAIPLVPPVPFNPDKNRAPEEDLPAVISGVQLSHLTAPSLAASAQLPWLAEARGDLSLDSLTMGSGLSLSLANLKFSQASATLPANAIFPDFSLVVSYQADHPQLDSLIFSGAEVPDLSALLRCWGIAPNTMPAAAFSANANLRDLTFKAGQLHATATQTLTLSNIKLDFPSQGKISAHQLTLHAVPDEMASARRLRLVELISPQIDLLLQSSLTDLSEPPDLPSPISSLPTAYSTHLRPAWDGWNADILTLVNGNLVATLPSIGNACITTGLAICTTPPDPANAPTLANAAAASFPSLTPSRYQLTLAKPQLIHPAFPGQPIALASAIQLTASAVGLWQRREIESLILSGSQLQIGEALFRLVKALPTTPPPPLPPPNLPPHPNTSQVILPLTPSPPALPPWQLGRLVLENTLVQLDHLGDGRRLDIPIKRQEFRNLPLDPATLATVDRLYKIEVPNITLYNPWVEGQKAAVLDTNYIQFTPSGLLKRQLERVDLMLPSLYAGQALFDFVDATRQHFEKLTATKPEPSPDAPLLVDNTPGSPTVLSALASVTPSSMATTAAEWHIPFYTESGKVFVAPKGFPWPNLPVIPFRNARDVAGKPIPFLLRGETFHGELAVEPGWYDFPEYKLRLRLSDRGRIIFNTPQKDHDNNLTEVFINNTLIFRQLRIDQVWLSITYDANGIYAKYGGLTCGGTINGGFNLYLDELYTWDAWASLTSINMRPLTDKLTPNTFRMTGPIDELTLKAYGDTNTLYQAILQLGVTKPGLLHLLALDSLKDELTTLGGLSGDLGKISLDALRDFPYTGCTGSLKLFGTEGHGHLHLTGFTGSRTFNLRLHDYRAKLPKSVTPF